LTSLARERRTIVAMATADGLPDHLADVLETLGDRALVIVPASRKSARGWPLNRAGPGARCTAWLWKRSSFLPPRPCGRISKPQRASCGSRRSMGPTPQQAIRRSCSRNTLVTDQLGALD
jgi:hypothetical protein